MKAVRTLQSLAPIDVKSVRRDSLLRWLVAFPVLIALLMRWGTPAIADWLMRQYQFDLTPSYPLITSCVLLMSPMMYGAVIGFLLLDQRDDQTLTALQVTPLRLTGYLWYRLTVPIILSVVMSVVVVPLTGLVDMTFSSLLVAGVGAAPMAPCYALYLVAFARNKVQGFALMKAAGAFLWPIMVAYFVHSRWQLAFGVIPVYWPAKLFWILEADESYAWLTFVTALVYQGAVLALLIRRFNKVMHE